MASTTVAGVVAALGLSSWIATGETVVKPLSPSGSGTPVGFTELAGPAVGIDFRNLLPDEALIQNINLANGSGVAAGDFDGDGRCDLYFCAVDGTNTLYRNLGDWRFEDCTAESGLTQPYPHCTGAVFADLNGDAALDLLVSSLGGGVHSYLNDGTGRFRETTAEAGLSSTHGSTTMALGDVDGDGDLDLYVANYGAMSYIRSAGRAEVKQVNGQWVFTGPMANRLSLVNGRIQEIGEPDVLLLNDGMGGFAALPWTGENFLDELGRPMAAPPDYGLTAQIRDINGDGWPDIYVCNDFQTPDRLWLNDNHGHFRLIPRLAIRHESFSAMSVDFADIDRDGFLDFFVTEMWPRDPRVRQRQITGSTPVFPLPGRYDNRPDVVRNTLFRNRGDDTYAEIAHFSGVEGSDWTWSQAFLDVDLDGYEDLMVINGMLQDVQDRDTGQRIRNLGKQTVEESRLNLLLYPPFLTPNVVWRNQGDLTFTDRSVNWGFAATNISTGLVLADLDNDGDQDAIVNTLRGGPLLYRNNVQAARVAVRLHGPAGNTQGIGAKVRLEGGPVPEQMQEIVAGGRYLGGDDPMRTFAAAPAHGPLVIRVDWPDGRRTVVEDVLPNHLYEIGHLGSTVSKPVNSSTPPPWFQDLSGPLNHVHHEEAFDDYARQPLLYRQFSSLGPGITWCDLDGDGWEDLLVGSGKGGRLAAFRNQQGRALTLRTEAPFNTPAIRDLTTLLPVPETNGTVAILAGSANYEDGIVAGSLARTYDVTAGAMRDELPAPTASTGPMAMADYDADGDLDLFVGGQVVAGRYPEPADSWLFRREGGAWKPDAAGTALLKGVGRVNGAVWTDLTGDGYPELVLAGEWGPIRMFRNAGGRLAPWNPPLKNAPSGSPTTLDALTGWWTGIQAGDFNGDGRLDLIVGNWGGNTGYHANPDHPLRLYYGDLLEQGVVDVIETTWVPQLDSEAPLRPLSALSRAIPVLGAAFPTHRAFSAATLDQVLAALPNRPARVEAVTLDPVVLLNQEDGFHLLPLPREARFSPTFGLCVADFDGDGAEDVFLSQNCLALRPEWPRMDAGRGLLLQGDGQGGFTPVPGQISGITIQGEGRGVAMADFDHDGRPDLAVGENGTTTHLYLNRHSAAGIRLRLDAGPENPWGIGAVVRTKDGNRWGAAREVRLGGGWWSADAPVILIPRPTGAMRIEVRWPGGTTTEEQIPAGSTEVLIRHER